MERTARSQPKIDASSVQAEQPDEVETTEELLSEPIPEPLNNSPGSEEVKEPVQEDEAPIKSIGNSNTLGVPGRNKSDKDHAYNVWLFQAHGDLLPGSWVNPEKFKSYVKHHPPKLIFTPEDGWKPNPKKRKGRTNGTARKNGSSNIIPIAERRKAR